MQKPVFIIAVDPGSDAGAIATLAPDRIATTQDLPKVGKQVDAVGLSDLVEDFVEKAQSAGWHVEAVVEKVAAFPKQGAVSSFNFGTANGMILGVLAGKKIPIIPAVPNEWKRKMRLNRDGEVSRALALRLYPELSTSMARKKDHNRAEALLIAHWRAFGKP